VIVTFDNQPSQQQNAQLSYGAAPETPPSYGAPAAQNAPGAPAPGALKRNPLGLASLVTGAVGILGALLFAGLQISLIRTGNMDALGALSTANIVLTALFGIAAVILGVIAVLRRAASKALASAGIALGGALIVSLLNALIYQVVGGFI
jgi:hypothetical protein